jgi:hypothetical protein
MYGQFWILVEHLEEIIFAKFSTPGPNSFYDIWCQIYDCIVIIMQKYLSTSV